MPQQPLSETARKAFEQAQQEARALNQEFVGTEHLLLALLASSGTQVSRLLRQYHVDKDALRSQIRSILPYSENPPIVHGQLPLSPKAQRVLNSAIVMSRSLREPTVSTRLIMLTLLDDSRASTLRSMKESGVDVEGLLRALSEKPHEPEP
jgi:ATP-dependent Clp protease ATP-binding subunit ClpC